MSKKLLRSDALEDVSTWSTNDVLGLLRKNGLEECCKAVEKRQVDGDELLHLTEGKLALWKSDLTRSLIWELWSFVEELRREPERFVEEKLLEAKKSIEYLSDTDSWGTDFEDEVQETVANTNSLKNNTNKINSDPKNNVISTCPLVNTAKSTTNEKITKQEDMYANCESSQDDQSMYENFQDTKTAPPKSVLRLQGKFEKSLSDQLKEELKLRDAKKPMLRPKPEALPARKIGINTPKQLPKPFAQNVPKTKQPVINESQKRMAVPPPPEPKWNTEVQCFANKPDKSLPKPPMSIRNLDLVANLPPRTEESEDEYEPFDEQIIEQNQKKSMSRVDSKQSLASGRYSSQESIYNPPSTVSHEEEESYEIYESITETPEDSEGYLRPIQRPANSLPPPPLPAKLPPCSTPSPPPSNRPVPPISKERSPDKKSATLPHSSSNTSISSERATRPLPPPPDRQSYTDKPWFHNVTREQATALIEEQSTYGNPQDGYFLFRPSTTNLSNPLTLVLWYKDRVYNVPVRKRPDNRYALGKPKVKEQSFATVEEIVPFYMKEELVLNTDGTQTGSTKLTSTPPK